jgi:hypothetical protein
LGNGIEVAEAVFLARFAPWIEMSDPALIIPALVVPEAAFTTPPRKMEGIPGATTNTELEKTDVWFTATLKFHVPPSA